jgi:hypothetical protein
MKDIIEKVTPDAKYKLLSVSENQTQVVYCATFEGSHTGEGGPGIFFFFRYNYFLSNDF